MSGSYNDYFIIDDRKEVIQIMEYMNANRKKGGSKSVNTYDFSTLYTSIPHDKLKEKLNEFIHHAFNESGKKYVNISRKNLYLSIKKSNKADVSFSSSEIMKSVEIIIDNAYILYKKKIFRQVIGIPMGTSCAPYLANIFLYMYESKYIHELIKNHQFSRASLLNKIYRYQDDAIVFNDHGHFNNVYKDIYPKELVLAKTSSSNNICNYLDLTIELKTGKFSYCLFDKRNDFNFDVISYPFLSGNIPKIPSYGVYVSQLIRFCYVSSKSVANLVKTLNSKLVKQGFQLNSLKHKFESFALKYIHLWSKYGTDITSDDYLNSVFCS